TSSVLELARRPPMPRTDIGSAHDAIGTRATDAQALYDQGLAYLHAYWWLEAARSFNQALVADPSLGIAPPALSIADTGLSAPEAAGESLAAALKLAPRANAHDRRHIELRALQMAGEREGRWTGSKGDEFRAAVDSALAEFPGDEELWLLR